MGAGGIPELPGGAAGARDYPSGKLGVSGEGGGCQGGEWWSGGVSGYIGGDGFAHADGERPGGSRLGSRGDRSGGGDARTARLHDGAGGGRSQADGRVARGSNGNGSRAHGDGTAAEARGRGQGRRGLRPPPEEAQPPGSGG